MSETASNPAESQPQTPPPPEAPVDPRDQELARLTAELEAARKRVDELARAYQAGERDREAFKQRVQRERDQLLDMEKGKVALVLLEAVDELDRSLQAADDSPLARGVRLIRDSVLKKVEAAGIERVELLGKPYDPTLAEATDMEITTVEADDARVQAVTRACYQLKGKVLRPGQVKVAKYVKPAEA